MVKKVHVNNYHVPAKWRTTDGKALMKIGLMQYLSREFMSDDLDYLFDVDENDYKASCTMFVVDTDTWGKIVDILRTVLPEAAIIELVNSKNEKHD